MKRIFLCAALSAIVLGLFSHCNQPDDNILKVATYNLRFANTDDGENFWPNRSGRVEDLIRYHRFDVFGTQEGFYSQLQDIASMGIYDYVGVGRDDGVTEGEHSAIFYRRDRFEVLEKGDFWLSETPEKPSYGWEAGHRRICSWAHLEDMRTKVRFYFFNVHFDHIATTARRESAKLLLSRIDSITGGKYPVICTGDFNATPDQEPIRIMKSGMTSTRDIAPFVYGPGGTFGGFTVGARPLDGEIDYIFINDSANIEIVDYAVLTDSDGKNYPSDHLPVTAKIRFK